MTEGFLIRNKVKNNIGKKAVITLRKTEDGHVYPSFTRNLTITGLTESGTIVGRGESGLEVIFLPNDPYREILDLQIVE